MDQHPPPKQSPKTAEVDEVSTKTFPITTWALGEEMVPRRRGGAGLVRREGSWTSTMMVNDLGPLGGGPKHRRLGSSTARISTGWTAGDFRKCKCFQEEEIASGRSRND